MRDLSLMGLLEVVPNLRRLAGRMAEAEADILKRRPAALVTIDVPSFALRLAAVRNVAVLDAARKENAGPLAIMATFGSGAQSCASSTISSAVMT